MSQDARPPGGPDRPNAMRTTSYRSRWAEATLFRADVKAAGTAAVTLPEFTGISRGFCPLYAHARREERKGVSVGGTLTPDWCTGGRCTMPRIWGGRAPRRRASRHSTARKKTRYDVELSVHVIQAFLHKNGLLRSPPNRG